jgi:hypothetical protein
VAVAADRLVRGQFLQPLGIGLHAIPKAKAIGFRPSACRSRSSSFMNALAVIWTMEYIAWHLQGKTHYFAHAAFVPLTPGTIVDLELILRNYTEREK